MISFIGGKRISWGQINVKQGANFFLEAGVMFYLEGGHLTPKFMDQKIVGWKNFWFEGRGGVGEAKNCEGKNWGGEGGKFFSSNIYFSRVGEDKVTYGGRHPA